MLKEILYWPGGAVGVNNEARIFEGEVEELMYGCFELIVNLSAKDKGLLSSMPELEGFPRSPAARLGFLKSSLPMIAGSGRYCRVELGHFGEDIDRMLHCGEPGELRRRGFGASLLTRSSSTPLG